MIFYHDYTFSVVIVWWIEKKTLILYPKGMFRPYAFYIIMEPNRISVIVKSLRKEYNLTQEDLALKSGVGLRFLRELEQGKSTVRLDKVNQVLNMFNKEVGVCDMERSL